MLKYHQNRKSLQAFTLLEILASIAIFAVMTLGIASTMQQTHRLSLKLKQRQASVVTGINGVAKMHRDLQMAYNERLQKTPCLFKCQEASTGFDCRFTTIDSNVKILFQRRTPGILIVRYWLEKTEGTQTFQLLRAELPLDEASKIEVTPGQLVTTGITKWEMEFYQQENDQWLKTWDTAQPATSRFPKAIKFALETVDPEAPKEAGKDKSLRMETTVLVLNEWEDR